MIKPKAGSLEGEALSEDADKSMCNWQTWERKKKTLQKDQEEEGMLDTAAKLLIPAMSGKKRKRKF